MKRFLLVLTLSIFVVTLTKAQELPSYVPSEGLVAYYPFNGNANDVSKMEIMVSLVALP